MIKRLFKALTTSVSQAPTPTEAQAEEDWTKELTPGRLAETIDDFNHEIAKRGELPASDTERVWVNAHTLRVGRRIYKYDVVTGRPVFNVEFPEDDAPAQPGPPPYTLQQLKDAETLNSAPGSLAALRGRRATDAPGGFAPPYESRAIDNPAGGAVYPQYPNSTRGNIDAFVRGAGGDASETRAHIAEALSEPPATDVEGWLAWRDKQIKVLESLRRETHSMGATPVSGLVDYAAAGQAIELAFQALDEGIPNGQKERCEVALNLLRDGVETLREWMRAKGYGEAPFRERAEEGSAQVLR